MEARDQLPGLVGWEGKGISHMKQLLFDRKPEQQVGAGRVC